MDKIILPLSNGVGVLQNEKLCVSVIDKNGNKKVGGERIKKVNPLWKLPILRAFFFLGFSIYFYVRAFFIEQEITKEKTDRNKSAENTGKISATSNFFLILSSIVAIFILGFLIVGLLPSKIFDRLFSYSYDYYFHSFMIAVFRLALLYIILVGLRFFPVMSSFYSFNGAGCQYFKGKEYGIKSTCYPLNFLNFLINVFCFSTFMISLVSVRLNWLVNFVINLGIFAFSIPLCYEYLRFATFSKLKWLKDFSFVTNWLVVISPNITHKEVLLVAKREIEEFDDFAVTGGGDIPMSALYAEMTTKLQACDKFEQSDVDWIIATVLNKNRAEIKLCRTINAKQYRDIMRACERRAKGEPLSNIFGFVEFYGLRFEVNKKVLSPRMDTEVLVEEVIKKAEETDAKNILDLCTGSGAIAVTLAKYTNCKIFASDISKQALAFAQINAKNNEAKVDFCQSDLTKGLKKGRKYDIIVSNPPYIKSGDIEKLDIEVKKYDPKLALDGGEDGLDFYREIAVQAKEKLTKKGWIFLEVGKGQADDVCEILQTNGFDNVQTKKDYNKIERVVYGRISK